jgi:hypothetical protein
LDALRESGASVAELNNATLGITDSIFAELRTTKCSRVIWFTSLTISFACLFIPLYWIDLSHKQFSNVLGVLQLYFIIETGGIIFMLSNSGKDVAISFLNRRDKNRKAKIVFIAVFILLSILVVFTGVSGFMEMYPNMKKWSIWDIIIVGLFTVLI